MARKKFPANNESKKHLESLGWRVWKVEQTVAYSFIKQDCWGFADLLAMNPELGKIMLVQVTAGASRGNVNKRLEKLRAEPLHIDWLMSGGEIEVHNWHGNGSRRDLEVTKVTA